MRPRVIAAIVLTVLLLFGAGTSLVLVAMVPFLFDAPGTEDQPATWAMALAVLSAPVMCLLSIIGVWIAAFPEGRSSWWYASLALPLLSFLGFWIAGSLRPGFF
ncbi:MAG: hypothetical protein ACKOD5_14270 [Chthoniobacterales bacterium]